MGSGDETTGRSQYACMAILQSGYSIKVKIPAHFILISSVVDYNIINSAMHAPLEVR